MLEGLKETLNEVLVRSGKDFSGIGLILYENSSDLPIFPLRRTFPDINKNDIVESLILLSTSSSEYHDGFHLISTDWQLTHVSQFFSPPIIENPSLSKNKLFGSRYITALFGSALPNVIFTGIASQDFGLAIFKEGKEVYYKKDNQ